MRILVHPFKIIVSTLLPPSSILNSADDLVDQFHNCECHNVIVPAEIKTLLGMQKAPWRNAAPVTVRKRERHKAEQNWQETNFMFIMTSTKRASMPAM